jgi:hypothetical protein
MNRRKLAQKKIEDLKLIKNIKNDIKEEQEIIDKFEEYDEDLSLIDDVDISFQDLDVSAKTLNGEIILNEKLKHSDWDDMLRYVVHELVHVLQQRAGKVNQESQAKDYLDDENEIEAFQTQLSFMSDNDSPEEIQEYLEGLLDHHNIKGKERVEKIKKLVEEI